MAVVFNSASIISLGEDGHDDHPDHVATFEACSQAIGNMTVKIPHIYRTENVHPENINIEGDPDTFREVVSAHLSQFDPLDARFWGDMERYLGAGGLEMEYLAQVQ